jgi:hypothetical protein
MTRRLEWLERDWRIADKPPLNRFDCRLIPASLRVPAVACRRGQSLLPGEPGVELAYERCVGFRAITSLGLPFSCLAVTAIEARKTASFIFQLRQACPV